MAVAQHSASKGGTSSSAAAAVASVRANVAWSVRSERRMPAARAAVGGHAARATGAS